MLLLALSYIHKNWNIYNDIYVRKKSELFDFNLVNLNLKLHPACYIYESFLDAHCTTDKQHFLSKISKIRAQEKQTLLANLPGWIVWHSSRQMNDLEFSWVARQESDFLFSPM